MLALCQSSNDLFECTCRQLSTWPIPNHREASRSWVLVLCNEHAAQMLNQVQGQLGHPLTGPAEWVQSIKPDSSTWFELYSIGNIFHSSNLGSSNLKLNIQAQSLDGIMVGRNEQFNTIIFHNPLTKKLYHSPNFHLNEVWLPITNFHSSIQYEVDWCVFFSTTILTLNLSLSCWGPKSISHLMTKWSKEWHKCSHQN